MEINNINGAAAYNNISSATSPGTAQQNQTTETDRNTTPAQNAFEVNLTQEAQNLQAQQAGETDNIEQAQPAPAAVENSNQDGENRPSQIVNIIA